jgi:hypothetical protein
MLQGFIFSHLFEQRYNSIEKLQHQLSLCLQLRRIGKVHHAHLPYWILGQGQRSKH